MMSKHLWRFCPRNRLGLIAVSVGIGLVMAVIIPVWGWIIAVGGGLICIGWFIIDRHW